MSKRQTKEEATHSAGFLCSLLLCLLFFSAPFFPFELFACLVYRIWEENMTCLVF